MRYKEVAWMVNRILLALVMLVPAFFALFIWKPAGVIANMSSLGFPAPVFFAWLLIIAEVIFGLAVLFRWQLKYTVWPPIIILVVAAFTAGLGNWPQIMLHLVAASNFWALAAHYSINNVRKNKGR